MDEKRNPIIAKNIFFLKDDVWKEKRREIDSALTGAKVGINPEKFSIKIKIKLLINRSSQCTQ